MAISVNWATGVITVPQADLTFISGTLYEMDTDVFRLALKALEAGVEGMPFADTHAHNTEVTVAGTTFARTVEILAPYSVTFTPNSQWSVRLVGSNNNIFDVENGVLNQNQVQVIPGNSAGLIKATGSGLTAGEAADLKLVKQMLAGNATVSPNNLTVTVFDDDGVTPLATFDISADARIRTRTS